MKTTQSPKGSLRSASPRWLHLSVMSLLLVGSSFVLPARGSEDSYHPSKRPGQHELIIDGFRTPIQRVQAVAVDGVVPVTVGAIVKDSMIGGESDLLLRLEAFQTPGTGVSVEIEKGSFNYHQDAGTTAGVILHYDGLDDSVTQIHASTGLGGVDLTGGGAYDRAAIKILHSIGRIDLSLAFLSDTEDGSEITKTVPPSDVPGTIWFPFSELIASKGNGADLTAVTAIVVVLGADDSTDEADITLGCITTMGDPRAPKVLHDQLRSRVDTSNYAVNFPGMNPFDFEIADDVMAPPGKMLRVGGLRFDAFYLGPPPANPTIDIAVYADDAGMPGDEVLRETGVELHPTVIPETWEALLDKPWQLGAGRHWIGFQANVPIGTEWHVYESNVPAGAPYFARNPGGALAPDCTTWTMGSLCLGSEFSLAMAVLGPLPSGTGTAYDDHYECFGNLSIEVPFQRGLLANDALGGGEIVAFDTTTPEGASVYVAADGAFTYTPRTGFVGEDMFTYQLADGSEATVHISVSRAVWAINNDPEVVAHSSNRGTPEDPFVSLAAYNASTLPQRGDIAVFYPGTYDGSLKLQDRQIVVSDANNFLAELVGGMDDHKSLNLPASLALPGAPATIQSPDGNAVTLARDNTLIGITLSGAPGGYAVKGSDFGRLTTYGVNAFGPGARFDLENGSLSAKYTNIFVLSTTGTETALRWSVGPMEDGVDGAAPDEARHCGFDLTLMSSHFDGPAGGVDARVFGSVSATVTATNSSFTSAGTAFAVTSQDTSALSATFTGNTVAGVTGDFWFTREGDSTFTFPGFTGNNAEEATAFIQDNSDGVPRVSFDANFFF